MIGGVALLKVPTRFALLLIVLSVLLCAIAILRHHMDSWGRQVFDEESASLTVGPEEVTLEDRGGRRRRWSRAEVIGAARVERPHEDGTFYEVKLFWEDGSRVLFTTDDEFCAGMVATINQVLGAAAATYSKGHG